MGCEDWVEEGEFGEARDEVKSASLAKELNCSSRKFDSLDSDCFRTAFSSRSEDCGCTEICTEGMVLARLYSSWPCDAPSVMILPLAESEDTDSSWDLDSELGHLE